MEKQLKDMVQFCRNTQPIPGQIYPTETTKPAEWFIGRPDSDYRFRFFINDIHARELVSNIPMELRDTNAALTALRKMIREEIKAEYEVEILELTKLLEQQSSNAKNSEIFYKEKSELDDVVVLEVPEDNKTTQAQVFRCLDTGMDFGTLDELQAHQLELNQGNVPSDTTKRPTPQERLSQRTGKG